jgi:NADPH-dependent curcumin reductase CurA
MMPKQQRRVVVTSWPTAAVSEANFRLESDAPVLEPGPGQVLVRTLYLALDPYMRGVLSEGGVLGVRTSIGEPMRGGVVGEVVTSNNPDFAVGDIVEDRLGWEEYSVGPRQLMRKVDPSVAPVSTANSILGMTGMTAYFGLFEFTETKPGETVVVSGAAGGVGQAAVQLAKIAGCRVVGIAGGPEKCAFVRELGADAVIDYKAERDIAAAVKAACPAGVDVYFDLTSGPVSDAVMANLRLNARIAVVGGSSGQPAPAMSNFIGRRITARGFIIFDHAHRWAPAIHAMGQLVKDGRLKYRDAITDGLENAPRAFVEMLAGKAGLGKPQVKVAAER